MASVTPWLSVLMPVLDGGRYIEEALASVAVQEDSGIECIIVDGGSSDRTVACARQFGKSLRLRILEKPESSNWVWSTNLALELASAPYCSILHQDDFWLPGRAAAVKDLMSQVPDIGLYVHDVTFVDTKGRRVGSLTCPWPSRQGKIESREALMHLLIQNFLSCPAPVFSTALARRMGGLDSTLWYTADWDFWLKLVRRTPVAYRREALAAFRLHEYSQTVRESRNQQAFRSQLDLVTSRHVPLLESHRAPASVLRAAEFSNGLNAWLAARFHGNQADWRPLLKQGLALGPVGLVRFLRSSRILSRSIARLRANLMVRMRRLPS